MRRSSLLTIVALAGTGLVLGRLAPSLAVRFDGRAPAVGWTVAGAFAVAAVLVGGVAWSTWQAVHKKKRTVHSEHALRLLALAKSSIVVSALFAGGYAGFALAYASAFDTDWGRDQVIHAGAAAVGALLLLVTALLLERACLVPGAGDDEAPTGASPSTA